MNPTSHSAVSGIRRSARPTLCSRSMYPKAGRAPYPGFDQFRKRSRGRNVDPLAPLPPGPTGCDDRHVGSEDKTAQGRSGGLDPHPGHPSALTDLRAHRLPSRLTQDSPNNPRSAASRSCPRVGSTRTKPVTECGLSPGIVEVGRMEIMIIKVVGDLPLGPSSLVQPARSLQSHRQTSIWADSYCRGQRRS